MAKKQIKFQMKKSKVLLLIPFLICCLSLGVSAQDKWDLRRCVEYALANNLSVQQTNVQADACRSELKNKPGGRNIPPPISAPIPVCNGAGLLTPPPTSLPVTSLLFQGYNFSAGVTVFNWHRIRNNMIAADLNTDAAKTDVEKIKNDIALNVATYYLQVLLSGATNSNCHVCKCTRR